MFEAQSKEYKESVLPRAVTKRLAIEMGSTLGWHRYVGLDGDVVGIDTFGASAPGEKDYGRVWFHSRKCCCESKSIVIFLEKNLSAMGRFFGL
ncbi:hypothetical protein GCM10020331_049720 [Ectobacillus funiculus]